MKNGHTTTPPDPTANHIHVIRRTAPPEARIIRIAGVTFPPTYPNNLHRLRQHHTETQGGETPAIILKPNPGNPYDSNAIEVHAPVLGDDAMIGHLPARWAAHPDRPGCEIRVWATK